jgi:hypothetical protein
VVKFGNHEFGWLGNHRLHQHFVFERNFLDDPKLEARYLWLAFGFLLCILKWNDSFIQIYWDYRGREFKGNEHFIRVYNRKLKKESK